MNSHDGVTPDFLETRLDIASRASQISAQKVIDAMASGLSETEVYEKLHVALVTAYMAQHDQNAYEALIDLAELNVSTALNAARAARS